MLLIYVDDILLASNNMELIQATKDYPDSEFKIKDLRCVEYFLGLELGCFSIGMNLTQ